MTDYKIGEVARLLGLTTQALRFYEQEGVVTPKKSENGTRYYDEDQLILLLSFKKYRQADFSVQDIVTHFFQGGRSFRPARADARAAGYAAGTERAAAPPRGGVRRV